MKKTIIINSLDDITSNHNIKFCGTVSEEDRNLDNFKHFVLLTKLVKMMKWSLLYIVSSSSGSKNDQLIVSYNSSPKSSIIISDLHGTAAQGLKLHKLETTSKTILNRLNNARLQFNIADDTKEYIPLGTIISAVKTVEIKMPKFDNHLEILEMELSLVGYDHVPFDEV